MYSVNCGGMVYLVVMALAISCALEVLSWTQVGGVGCLSARMGACGESYRGVDD